jgi:hypothetical protein
MASQRRMEANKQWRKRRGRRTRQKAMRALDFRDRSGAQPQLLRA